MLFALNGAVYASVRFEALFVPNWKQQLEQNINPLLTLVNLGNTGVFTPYNRRIILACSVCRYCSCAVRTVAKMKTCACPTDLLKAKTKILQKSIR